VVVLVARDKDKLEQTAAVRSAGAEALIHDPGLRELQSAEAIVKGTPDRFVRIDALLNIRSSADRFV
jgi:NADP-dependent 3-hydroxy acid dehydrogenase YdfG